MSEVINENIQTVERQNPFCVISKDTFGDYAVHDIQTNIGWTKNPYGDTYAVVPDDMVTGIVETCGFCDITLNEDGTEVASYTAREIPEIPEPEAEPTQEERITVLEEIVEAQETQLNEMTEYQAEMLYELSLMQLGITE